MVLNIDEAISKLVPLLESGRLVIFTGTGISVKEPSRLPTWDGMMTEFISFCRNLPNDVKPKDFDALLDDCEKMASKNPTMVASVLKNNLVEMSKKASRRGDLVMVENSFQDWFLDVFQEPAPNDNHKTIISTNYKFIVTSNYDDCLRKASRDLRFSDLLQRVYSYSQADLIASAIYNNKPAIIHIHGRAKDVTLNRFVLTSEDYRKITREFPGFSLAIASLFLQYSVLFIGYGGSDPHVEEIVELLANDFNWHAAEHMPQYFLMLKSSKIGPVIEKYKQKLRTDLIGVDDYDKETTPFLEALSKACPR